MNKVIISPSILSADFAYLEREIRKVEEAGADWIHIDVMDGNFVPNITIGSPVVKCIRKVTELPLDVHLMIESPEKHIDSFIDAGADIITVHYEACENNIKELVEKIRVRGIKAGVSIKPKTPVKVIEKIITDVDLVLIMTVEPGFGGQKFIFESIHKIQEARKLLDSYMLSEVYLQVDGGIDDVVSELVRGAGANNLVAGSYIYRSADIPAAIHSLKN